MTDALPIDAAIPGILDRLRAGGALVLTASPGSGKTTRVPPALLDDHASRDVGGEIWVLEPRRLAARAAARRVAWERGTKLGEDVGFVVRHERVRSKSTRLVFVTEGILLRRILADPELRGIATVVLDELHERHVETDLTLAMLRDVRDTLRPDLEIVAMSATLDAESVTRYLGAVHVAVSGQVHEVETVWDQSRDDAPLEERIARACAECLHALDARGDTQGGVLAFLPGMREIRRAERALAPLSKSRGVRVLPLHGRLDPKEQDEAIRAHDARKIVLATNVAESSITVDGIRAVVDSGLARVMRRDPRSGLDRLRLESISRASADQRRGRAGRTGPGFCRRLWARGEERQRPAYDDAEILRVDVAGPWLAVRAFAGVDAEAFDWFEAPRDEDLRQADDLLRRLGALEPTGRLSARGRAMQKLPLPPRLARIMVEAEQQDCVYEAAIVAAILQEGDPLRGAADTEDEAALLARVRTIARGDLQAKHARSFLRAVAQLARGARPRDELDPDALVRALLAGYPDRVARRSELDATEAFLVGGTRVRLGKNSLAPQVRFFLALDLRSSDAHARDLRDARVGFALPVDVAQLDTDLIEETTDSRLSSKEGRVRSVQRRSYLGLTLDERVEGDAPIPRARPLLEELLRKDVARWLGTQTTLRALQARVAWLEANAAPSPTEETAIPVDDASLVPWLLDLLDRPALAALSKLDLGALLLAREPGLRQRLAREAPQSVALPTGREAQIDYAAAAGPTVRARVQELFGCRSLPRIGRDGQTALILEILGPNSRPVQVTQDLEGFWHRTYPTVRAELKRRYPKHAWPEEPLAATPESRPKRRRR